MSPFISVDSEKASAGVFSSDVSIGETMMNENEIPFLKDVLSAKLSGRFCAFFYQTEERNRQEIIFFKINLKCANVFW